MLKEENLAPIEPTQEVRMSDRKPITFRKWLYVNRRPVLAFALSLVLLNQVIYRWTWLDREMVYVECPKGSASEMTLIFRRARPFDAVLEHTRYASPRPKWKDGWSIGPRERSQQECVAITPSKYDYWNGGYYVEFRFARGENLTTIANGQRFEIRPWTTPDAKNVKWHYPPGFSEAMGDGIGQHVVYFSPNSDEEVALVSVGTDVRPRGTSSLAKADAATKTD